MIRNLVVVDRCRLEWEAEERQHVIPYAEHIWSQHGGFHKYDVRADGTLVPWPPASDTVTGGILYVGEWEKGNRYRVFVYDYSHGVDLGIDSQGTASDSFEQLIGTPLIRPTNDPSDQWVSVVHQNLLDEHRLQFYVGILDSASSSWKQTASEDLLLGYPPGYRSPLVSSSVERDGTVYFGTVCELIQSLGDPESPEPMEQWTRLYF
jgi:hypothetical protein